jgi:hypothetical protein
MPTITVDGHSLSLDGRRLWIVSGSVHHARIPRELWRPRLLAARQAGLNTIETPAIWALHEPREGHFDFEGERDLRAFIELVAELGMRCILRVGPFVGDGYDLGGLPSWLVPAVERKVRAPGPEFLQAVSTYFGRLVDQIGDLQATRPGRNAAPGPIILVQCEHEWFCPDDETGHAYLSELARYLREAGITVPIANRNNLFTAVEGEIDTWTGAHGLHAVARQLRAVRPDQPRLVLGLSTGAADVWGEPRRSQRTPETVLSSMAEALSAGAQFNLAPFAGGTAFGFDAARLDLGPETFAASNKDHTGPVRQAGGRSAHYHAVKRLATFANSFSRVLTALDPDHQPIGISPHAVAPEVVDESTGRLAARPPAGAPNATVVHASGAQGDVVFLFANPAAGAGAKKLRTSLTLDDGRVLPVEIAGQPVVWLLKDVHLFGRATLDFCTLCPFAHLGQTLVVFGAPGAPYALSISGSPLQGAVPSGKTPAILEHEGVTLVVCNHEQIDAAYATASAVHIGAEALDEDDRPVWKHGFSTGVTVNASGEVEKTRASQTRPAPGRAPTLRDWSRAALDATVDGSNVRFARIPGPDSMERLGAPDGYGWIRLTLRSASARKPKVALFEAADRLHVYAGGDLVDVVGRGPGATPPVLTLPLKKGEQHVSILVDNLGRYDSGNALGQRKGVFGPPYEVTQLRPGAPKLVEKPALDPLEVKTPIFGLRHGERTDVNRLAWTFTHRKKTPILLALEPSKPVDELTLVLLNDEALDLVSPRQDRRLVIGADRLKRGSNTLELAVVGDMDAVAPTLRTAVKLYEGTKALTDNAEWSFAKWESPADDEFEPVAKADLTPKKAAALKGRPCWWRCEFTPTHADAPLFLDASGLSKGQMFLNGRNLGRYFVATHRGKAVPPQSLYYLPEPWLHPGEPNELRLFDEHGFAPTRCRLVYDLEG